MSKPENIITEALHASAVDLIRHYSGSIPMPGGLEKDPRSLLGATIDFTDEEFRGQATLLADRISIATLASDPKLRFDDWLRELSNQLVGRLKNRLLSYGLLPTLGIPENVCPNEAVQAGNESEEIQLQWPGGVMQIVFTLAVDAQGEVVPQPAADTDTAREGSLQLF